MRRTAIITWTALAGAAWLAACGGGGPATLAAPTTTSAPAGSATSGPSSPVDTGLPATTSSPGTTPPLRQRGTLLQVVAPAVTLNGGSVSSRTALHDHDLLETLATGEADFSLVTKVKTCTALKGTRVEVAPAPDTLLRWDRGSAICVTAAGGGTATFGAGAQAVLTVDDPVFQVSVDQGTTSVMVDKGFVSVGVQGGGRQMIVGFNEQASVTSDGPQGLGPFDATTDPNEVIFDRLARANPVPTYTRPAAGASPTLRQAFQRGRLNVSTSAPAGSAQAAFVQGAMAKLSAAWSVGAPSFVPDGQSDISVGPPGASGSPAGTASLDRLPLFGSGGVTWYLTFRADSGFKSALRTWLSTYLNSGDYGSAYTRSFDGQIPLYDVVRTILFGG